MNKTAFLFSGQGSQYLGMGKELLALIPSLSSIFSKGSEVLGFDLKEICFNSDEETLAKTEYSQPAIFAISLMAFYAIKEKYGDNINRNMVASSFVAGHSLGEYAAMVADGILTLEDGFFVIGKRARAMGECAKNQNGAMCAVIGSDNQTIETVCKNVCKQTNGYVVPVNFNSPAQTVIAGEADAVNAAIAEFEKLNNRAVKLNVSAAFHSKLMAPAADEFKKAIANITFHNPIVPFYSNLTGEQMTDFSDMPNYLSQHIVSPVYFANELFAMNKNGADTFIECGPNKVLTGLVKKTLKEVKTCEVKTCEIKAYNVENEKTLLKLADIF